MLRNITDHLKSIREIDAGNERKKVTILGAGIAGLTAALELAELGHKVEIFEANKRIGGRAWTQRFNVSDQNKIGDYHELGAMRIKREQDYTLHYVKICELKLRPFINHHENPESFYYIKGILSRHNEWKIKLLPELNLTERDLKTLEGPIGYEPAQLLNLFVNPIEELRAEIESNPADKKAILGDGPMTDKVKHLDSMTLGQFLKDNIDSQDALDLIGAVTSLEVWWDKAVSLLLREEMIAAIRHELQPNINKQGPKTFEIIDGTDMLPNILYQKVIKAGVKVHQEHSVFSISNRRDSVQIGILNKVTDESNIIDRDHVICTLPFGVLRQIELSGFNENKLRAIRNMTYASSTKVLFHTKNRFWEKNYGIHGGASQTDLISRSTYYPSSEIETSYNKLNTETQSYGVHGDFSQMENSVSKDKSLQDKPSVLVGSYCWGADARRLGALDKKGRESAVKKAISNFHPEIIEKDMVIDSASIFWDEYTYASGAFCFHRPGDFSTYFADSKKRENNLFFAGEHCSIENGWMQGAIVSSLEAVEELVSI